MGFLITILCLAFGFGALRFLFVLATRGPGGAARYGARRAAYRSIRRRR